METNECLHRNGGCWRDEATNMMVCRDTYRGRVCECPMVNGVRYDGDGYTHCKGTYLHFSPLDSTREAMLEVHS